MKSEQKRNKKAPPESGAFLFLCFSHGLRFWYFGKRMKELRIQYGLTQQELADRSELTKGFISQLERNQNTPSIGTLLDIIQCLGTTPAEFFTDEEPEQIVFKNEDFFTKVNEDKHNIIEWVVPNAQKDSMEPVRLTLKAGGSSDIMQPHSGEEFF